MTVVGAGLCAVIFIHACHAGTASAAEVTRVQSGFDDARRFDFNIALAWNHEQRQSVINRELASGASTSQARLINDLIYHRSRDVLHAHIEMGVLRDVGLHVDLPYVLRDDRDLGFDQREGSGCVFPGGAGMPTCVNEQSSTLLRDGVLPGAGAAMYGVDARSGGQFSRPSGTVFRGPRRSGLESLGVGASWALMNQARDDTRPTWILGIDAKFDVGTTMRYDAGDPGGNTGVGLGYHQLAGAMLMSKRLGAMDPYWGVSYMFPFAGSESPFSRYPNDNQPHARPQSRANVMFGFEFVPWERPEISQRVVFEARVRGEHRFQGSSHSELWEPLSGSSGCGASGGAACRPGLDLDLDGDGTPDRPHPGVTETQAYSTLGGDLGFSVQAGKHTRFRGLFGYSSDLSHFITFATAGTDRDGDGRVDSMNPREANPAFREVLDIPGRRFKVNGSHIWNLTVELIAVF
ncbi:MAG: hypothetical protein ABUS79_03150 [Pseudomonadota bacterium]